MSDLASPSGAEGRKMTEVGKREKGEERCVVCQEAAESIRDTFRSSQLYLSFCEGKQGRQHITYCFSFSAALWQMLVPSSSRDKSAPGDLRGEPRGRAAESGRCPQLPGAGCCNLPWDYPSLAFTLQPSQCIVVRLCSSGP